MHTSVYGRGIPQVPPFTSGSFAWGHALWYGKDTSLPFLMLLHRYAWPKDQKEHRESFNGSDGRTPGEKCTPVRDWDRVFLRFSEFEEAVNLLIRSRAAAVHVTAVT